MSDDEFATALAHEIGDSFGELMNGVIAKNENANSPLDLAEGLRYLTRAFAWGALVGETENYHYPKFVPAASLWLQMGFANPDGGYWYTTVHGDYVYRVFGRRGTARIFDVESWSGSMSDVEHMHHCGGARHIHLDAHAPIASTSDFEVGPNGEFEVILSKDPQPGNWVPIADGLGWVLMREFFYDWMNEERGQFYIERVGATYPPPPTTTGDLQKALTRILEFMNLNVRHLAKGVEAQHYSVAPNAMHIQPMHGGQEERGQEDQIALRDIYFQQGRYDCGPDDAVILEVPEPESDYWLYYLLTHNWECIDFHTFQNTINGHHAHIDDDGAFRAVISQNDPGVLNWLDPAGHQTGLIVGRVFKPRAEMVTPQLRVVPFDELRQHLPAETKWVTAEERSEALRERMHSVRRRRCEI